MKLTVFSLICLATVGVIGYFAPNIVFFFEEMGDPLDNYMEWADTKYQRLKKNKREKEKFKK